MVLANCILYDATISLRHQHLRKGNVTEKGIQLSLCSPWPLPHSPSLHNTETQCSPYDPAFKHQQKDRHANSIIYLSSSHFLDIMLLLFLTANRVRVGVNVRPLFTLSLKLAIVPTILMSLDYCGVDISHMRLNKSLRCSPLIHALSNLVDLQLK